MSRTLGKSVADPVWQAGREEFAIRRLVLAGVTLALALPQCADAQSWSVQSVPIPTGATASELDSVSCTSASACVAVGHYWSSAPNGGFFPFAERWDGASWTLQAMPTGPLAIETDLFGLSCTSATTCMAVGLDYVMGTPSSGASGPWGGLAERWDGSGWTFQQLPGPQPCLNDVENQAYLFPTPGPCGSPVLHSVSCPNSTACTGAGDTTERWNGSGWSYQKGVQLAELYGVSCTSTTACIAVGENGNFPAAERWDGSVWRPQIAPSPVGPVQTARRATSPFSGVSCTSPAACTAVGVITRHNRTVAPFAERWNGSAWVIQSVPTGSNDSSLHAVSCSTATDCIGVGEFSSTSSNPASPQADEWNGTNWTNHSLPNQSGDDHLLSVSCVSPSTCTAVGYVDSSVVSPYIQPVTGRTVLVEQSS